MSPFPLRPIICALALACASLSAPTWASEPTLNVNIPAGSLEQSLTRLAREAHISLVFNPKMVQGRQAQALTGMLSIDTALAQLLAGSGYAAVRNADGSYSLQRDLLAMLPVVEVTAIKPLATVASAGEVTLPAVEVQGGASVESATGPVNGYVAKRSATGNKTDTPITEIPQSVSVMGADELRDRGVRSLDDALAYMPGVVGNTYGSDQRGYSWASIRGFPSTYTPTFRDGLFLFSGSFTTPLTEVYGLERVELLRGPASLMYGQADAGGIINGVSKTPHAAQINEVFVEYGHPQEIRGGLDIGGGNEQVLYRLVATAKDGETFRQSLNGEPTEIKRVYVAPSLTWKISDATKLTVLADYLRHEARNDGWPMPNANLQSTYWTKYNGTDPNYDQMKLEQSSIGYQLHHQINAQWQIDQNARYLQAKVPGYGWTWGTGLDANGAIERMTGFNDEWSKQTMIDTRVSGTIDAGSTKHKLVFGLDWLKGTLDAKAWYGAAHALDPLNPDYSTPILRPDALGKDERMTLDQLGFYLQDQIYIGQWLLSLGGRYDRTSQLVDNRLSQTRSEQDDSAFTGRAGISYLFESGLTPYLSYATSFKPEIGTNTAGQPYKPTEARQWEAGVKYAPAAQNMLLSAAIFDIVKSNVVTDDPAMPGAKKQTGEMRSRGLELEAKAELGQGWGISAQYSYTDVETTQGAADILGKRPENIPEHTASTWVDYRWQVGHLAGLQVGAGLRYMGSTYGDSANTRVIPSYTTADLNIAYPLKSWKLGLNVRNLFDRKYATTCYEANCYPGDPRRVTASAAYQW
jgi:iron complex outermembrane receptor protein